MQVEDISRICLAPGRTAENQRNLPVGHRLLAQVVIHHEGRTSRVPEILPYGSSCERSVVLHRGRIGCGRSHDYGVIHRALGAEGLHNGGHSGTLLPDGYIYAVNRLPRFEAAPLVYDGVDCKGRLARLAVADDEFALAAAYGYHRVDCLQSSLERFGNRLTVNHSWSLAFQGHREQFASYVSLAVKGFPEGIDDAAYHGLAYVYGCYAARTVDSHSFLYQFGGPEEHRSDIVLLQVHHHRLDSRLEFEEFAGFGVYKAVDAGYAVADLQYLAGLFEVHRSIDIPELVEKYLGNLAGFNAVLRHYTILLFFCTNWRRMSSICRDTLASSL